MWSFPFSSVMEAWKKTRKSEKLTIRHIKELTNTYFIFFFCLICSHSWMRVQLCCSVTHLLCMAMAGGGNCCAFSPRNPHLAYLHRVTVVPEPQVWDCSILMSISDSGQYQIIHRRVSGAPTPEVWPTDHTQKMFDTGGFLVFIWLKIIPYSSDSSHCTNKPSTSLRLYGHWSRWCFRVVKLSASDPLGTV